MVKVVRKTSCQVSRLMNVPALKAGHSCFGALPGLPGQKRKNKNGSERSERAFIYLASPIQDHQVAREGTQVILPQQSGRKNSFVLIIPTETLS
jgi:hypothetical protein